MNPSLPGLMDGLRRTLSAEVQPELQTDHARTQLAGVLDILSKLERMLVWSPDMLREQRAAMQAGRMTIDALANSAGLAVPWVTQSSPMAPADQAALEQAVRAEEEQLAALTDWLFDPQASLPPALRDEIDARLQQTLRATLVAQRRLVPRADFSAMTADKR